MTATTPKGLPYPQDGIDYLIDAAEHMQALAEATDTLLDGYRLLDIGGLTVTTKTVEADTVPIGTTEAAVITSNAFELTAPTQVEIRLSWDALTASAAATARWRIRPGNLGGTPVGGCRLDLPATRPAGGGSLSCYPTLPIGPYTIIASLQLSAGSAVVNASSEAPLSLMVRPLP